MSRSARAKTITELRSRLCAFEDKMTRLLDLIEGEQVVTEQFIKECRFLVKPMGRK